MLLLSLLACSLFPPSGPPEPPDRWEEVVALAALGSCRATEQPPASLQDLAAWQSSPEHRDEFIPGLRLYNLLGLSNDTVLNADALSETETTSVAKAVRDAERCGALIDVMVTTVIREQSCGSALHAQLGERPEPRSIAAREAVTQWQLIVDTTEASGRSRAVNETAIAKDWQDWVLDPAGPSPTGPRISKEAGVAGEVLGEGIAGAWNELVSTKPCLAP